jgi:phosphonate transport system substrate-binding protein
VHLKTERKDLMNKKVLAFAFVVLVIALAVTTAFPSLWREPEKLTFVFHPGETADLGVLREMFGPIVRATCEELDVECEMILATDYAAVMEALRNGTSDVSRVGATMYVLTKDEFPMRLVAWEIIEGEDHYHSVLLGKPGIWTEPFTFDQLKGKAVAFVTTSSTSGYLAPLTMMAGEGVALEDLGSYYFTENHPAAVEALLNGQVDVACTGDTIIREVVRSGRAVEGVDYVTLAVSPPLVSDAWTIGPGVDPEMADRIADVLLGLPPSAFEGSYLDGFTPVDLSAYEFNERMLRLTGQLP